MSFGVATWRGEEGDKGERPLVSQGNSRKTKITDDNLHGPGPEGSGVCQESRAMWRVGGVSERHGHGTMSSAIGWSLVWKYYHTEMCIHVHLHEQLQFRCSWNNRCSGCLSNPFTSAQQNFEPGRGRLICWSCTLARFCGWLPTLTCDVYSPVSC